MRTTYLKFANPPKVAGVKLVTVRAGSVVPTPVFAVLNAESEMVARTQNTLSRALRSGRKLKSF